MMHYDSAIYPFPEQTLLCPITYMLASSAITYAVYRAAIDKEKCEPWYYVVQKGDDDDATAADEVLNEVSAHLM